MTNRSLSLQARHDGHLVDPTLNGLNLTSAEASSPGNQNATATASKAPPTASGGKTTESGMGTHTDRSSPAVVPCHKCHVCEKSLPESEFSKAQIKKMTRKGRPGTCNECNGSNRKPAKASSSARNGNVKTTKPRDDGAAVMVESYEELMDVPTCMCVCVCFPGHVCIHHCKGVSPCDHVFLYASMCARNIVGMG